MITSIGLQQLGFKSLSFHEDGDFQLQDDGAGPYIKEWKSASPQPTQAEIETAEAAWHTANDYKFARIDSYPSVDDFMEAYTEKEIGSDSTKWDAYVIAYNKVRTDNPKS